MDTLNKIIAIIFIISLSGITVGLLIKLLIKLNIEDKRLIIWLNKLLIICTILTVAMSIYILLSLNN